MKKYNSAYQPLFLAILHHTAYFIIVFDTQGKVLFANQPFIKLINKSENEILHQSVSTIFEKSIADKINETNATIIADSKSITTDENTLFGIEKKIYSANQFAVFNENGKPYAIVHIYHEEKSTTSQKITEAEEANKIKSAFLASMSHEIRTPLNGILGMLSLLFDTSLTTEQREYIESARVSGDLLLSIINDILDFSKIESGRMELEQIDFKLQTLVDDTVQMIVTETQHKGIYIKTHIDPKIPEYLIGPSSRIRQVLSNLMNNAVKFTDNGGISVSVTLKDKKNDDVILSFEVSDTGIGITPEVRERLFQPFSQGNISTSRKYGGAGLGLVICKRLVEMMGGTIDFTSIPDVGSRFSFTIQLKTSTKTALHFTTPLSPDLYGTRILCVDDNAINQEIVKRQTEALHLRCDVASHGIEALVMMEEAMTTNDPYKLVIIDYVMSGMNGLELVKKIRNNDQLVDTKVIIMSSFDDCINTEDMQHLSISINITKPLRQQKLYDAIVTVLQSNFHILNKKGAQTETDINILIAEDNPINQTFMLHVLSKLGYRATPVENGLEALQSLQKNSYDLILMDCQMPIFDGYVTTKKIREIEKHSNQHIPIIAMTAHALKGDRDKCIDAGMDDYISKPIDIKSLDAILKFWLSKQPQTFPNGLNKTAPTLSQTELIDLNRLQDIFGNSKADINQYLLDFVNSSLALIDDIKNAINHNETNTIKSGLHRLKGSAANSGFSQLADLCLQTENHVNQLDHDHLLNACQSAEMLLKTLQDTITKQ